MSVLIDEEPKKRRKSSEKANGKVAGYLRTSFLFLTGILQKAKGESTSKSKAKKAAKEVLSPDEEQIKKLKAGSPLQSPSSSFKSFFPRALSSPVGFGRCGQKN